MGSKNAGTVFSHMIHTHIIGDLSDTATAYIDDVNVGFSDMERGLTMMKKLLSRLRKYNLRIGIDKIRLFSTGLEAFGLYFDKIGMKPTEERVRKMRNTTTPANKKSLLSALQSLNYFRTFIPKYAILTSRLYTQTGTATRYCQKIVDEDWPKLTGVLSDIIKIQCPDYDKPMILSTDASEFGLGMVLTQETPDGKRRIIGCHSKSLNKSERLWAIAQKELKGIYEGLVHFEQLIFNQLVIIETDNLSVYWLLKLNIGAVEINKRLPAVRFLLYISSYNYEIRHVSGKEPSFLLSDFLSRNDYELGTESKFIMGNTSKEPLIKLKAIVQGKYDTVPVNMIQPEGDKVDSVISVHSMEEPQEKVHKIIAGAQLESKFCRMMIDKPNQKHIVIDNVLFKKTTKGLFIVCPKFFNIELLKIMHNNQHESIRALIEKISTYRIWMYRKYRHVTSFVQNCKTCDPSRSLGTLKADNNTVARPHQPFDIVHIDLMNIGEVFVTVLVDSFSHFIVARVMRSGTSTEIKNALADVFCHYGIPHTVVQDNGANLNSAVMIQFYDSLGIIVSNSSVSNSRGNSLAELSIKRIQNKTRIFGTDNGNMSLNLYLIVHKLNLEKRPNRRHSAFEIMFARTSSWVLQLPELSKAKYYAQEKSLKMMFDTAEEIRKDMLELMEKRRRNITEPKMSPKLEKGDIVRIKKFVQDEIKKAYRPFTDSTWEVVSASRFTNTCILKERVETGFQPRVRRVHKRFVRKISKPMEAQDDDFEPAARLSDNTTENTKDTPEKKQSESKIRTKPKNEKRKVKRITDNKYKQEKASTHKMNLRRRR